MPLGWPTFNFWLKACRTSELANDSLFLNELALQSIIMLKP